MTNDLQSNETKLKMAEALKKLVRTKSFSKITVNDIVANCEINRNTFYYHFENMFDLLYWVYDSEIQNKIVTTFKNSDADITQGFIFIFDYIDNNIQLCQTACESLGEKQLKNMFERDLHTLLSSNIEFICKENNFSVSSDFKDFLAFNFMSLFSSQIVWYIKYNEQIDRIKFLDYTQTTVFSSLNATLAAANLKTL